MELWTLVLVTLTTTPDEAITPPTVNSIAGFRTQQACSDGGSDLSKLMSYGGNEPGEPMTWTAVRCVSAGVG